MANNYSTSTDAFADISEGSYSSSDYPAMASFVSVASRLIDAEVGRWDGFFYPTTDDKTDYYDGSGESEQEIDEYVSITSVSVSEQGGLSSSDYTDWTLNTDYLTWPYNAANRGKPINRLALVSYQGSKGAWYTGQKTVKVVGVPGYSATVHPLVEQACKVQSVRWFMRAKGGWQDVSGNESSGQLHYKGTTQLDPDVKAMLWPLKLELQR